MPLVFNQEAINGILFTLHFQKDSPIVAHQKLMEMTGKNVMNLNQITEFFKKIDNGEFQLKKEVKEVTLAHVLNIPEFDGRYLNIDARLRLRKTCKTIREALSEKSLNIDNFFYRSNRTDIGISTNDNFYVIYKIIEGGLSVMNEDSEKFFNMNEEEQIEMIQLDLTSILGHEKLRIDSFIIEHSRRTEELPIGMKALQNTFDQVPNKLKVRNLEYVVEENREVFLDTLKTMDPKHLKSLKLWIKLGPDNWVPRWDELNNVEQWKHLKSLYVDYWGLDVLDVIRFFTHLENAHLKIESFYDCLEGIPLHDLLMRFKDKLLQNHNLKQFKVRAERQIRNSHFEIVNATFQQYNTNNTPYPCWISFPYPDSDKKLEMLVERKMIWFKGPCYVEGEWEEEIDHDDDEEEDEDEEDDD
ncbi:hypothetical protein CRE_22933 [Caenorhabditis remanei]|uniref:DUF38 domain-containing protein n=1 Tax=Caenorhabditis remanei TaxID=31234 RepID=E3MW64_CAERE|nr:hypothetical protein CRE_22933 [Caenorhabditis remanei]